MSSCVCAYVDEGYFSSFVDARIVKARKSHVCNECGREIAVGEKYEYVFGVWEGDPGVYKTCSDCLSARSVFFCGGTWLYGQIWGLIYEALQESLDYIMLGQFDDLTPEARRRVVDYIDECFEEENE
jgi:hypothetical protein